MRLQLLIGCFLVVIKALPDREPFNTDRMTHRKGSGRNNMGYTPGAPYGGPSRYFGSDANINLKCGSALIQLSLCADTDTEK